MEPAGRSARKAHPLLAASILLVALLLPLLVDLPLPPVGYYFFGGLVVSTALLILLFVPTIRMARLEHPPVVARAFLAREIRRRGLAVAGKDDELTVHVGRLSAARVLVPPSNGGAEIRLANGATSSGWGTIVALIVLGWTGWLSVAVMLYVHFQVDVFLRNSLKPLLVTEPSPPSPGPRDEVDELLVDGLAEAHRLAHEAFEASRAVYHGRLALVALGAILGWLSLFLGYALVSGDMDSGRRMLEAVLLASGLSGALAVALGGLVRRWTRPRVLAHKTWVERLWEAWLAQTQGDTPISQGPGPFELLLGASRQVPDWIEVTRRAGMVRDPSSWLVVFVLLFTAWSFVSFLFFPMSIQLLAIGAIAGLVLAAALYYRAWRGRQDVELARERAAWDRRFEEVRRRMDQYLEGV